MAAPIIPEQPFLFFNTHLKWSGNELPEEKRVITKKHM
jgi:hypothetical protein